MGQLCSRLQGRLVKAYGDTLTPLWLFSQAEEGVIKCTGMGVGLEVAKDYK